MKKDKTVSKEEYIAELHKAIDLQTGLTLAQKKAAELSAQGLPDTKIAKMVGAHFNTVKNSTHWNIAKEHCVSNIWSSFFPV